MPLQPSPFLEQVIRLLMPFFLGSGIDPEAVRADILDTLDCYGVRTRAQMLYAAQALAFSLSAMDTLAEAKSAELSTSMRLRLRGCANSLNRSVQQNEQALAARSPMMRQWATRWPAIRWTACRSSWLRRSRPQFPPGWTPLVPPRPVPIAPAPPTPPQSMPGPPTRLQPSPLKAPPAQAPPAQPRPPEPSPAGQPSACRTLPKPPCQAGPSPVQSRTSGCGGQR